MTRRFGRERRKISLGSSPDWWHAGGMMVLRTPGDKIVGTVKDQVGPGVDRIRITQRDVEMAGREGIAFGRLVIEAFEELAERAERLEPFEKVKTHRVSRTRNRTIRGVVTALRGRARDWDRRFFRKAKFYRLRPSPPWYPETEADRCNRLF